MRTSVDFSSKVKMQSVFTFIYAYNVPKSYMFYRITTPRLFFL